MSHAPWTQEQKQYAAKKFADAHPSRNEFDTRNGFLAGANWAAEIIEASPTVYEVDDMAEWIWTNRIVEPFERQQQAKLVGVRKIEVKE